MQNQLIASQVEFQFTHPGKGATYPSITPLSSVITVSIHAPWEGCDCPVAGFIHVPLTFQFTHPGKGATIYYDFYRRQDYVSIHAPWEGCD